MTVMNHIKIVWIDDERDHEEDAKTLESKRKELEIEFVSPLQFENFLEKQEDGVDLFLIDDRLIIRGDSASTSFKRRGLSVAAQIREKFPRIPIYLFSYYTKSLGIYTTLAEAAESLADHILEYKTIQREGHNVLYYDSLDYRRIRESPHESVNSLLSLLDAPEVDHERIMSVLPEDLKRGLSLQSGKTRSAGNAIAFAKWTKRIFLTLPGFVYDSIYSATMLGMTEKSFLGHSSDFKDARYTGIFSETWGNNLWWASRLRDIIFEKAKIELPHEDTTDLQRLTQKLLHLETSDMAKCIVCNKPYPDTVGINHDHEKNLQPVHYRCSEKHPTKPQVLYFDEIRQFRLE